MYGLKRRQTVSQTADFKMDFYTKDFVASTLPMTGPESAVYALTLILAWTQNASLPADPERIRRMCRYESEEWDRVWPSIEPKWPVVDGVRRNPRQVRVLEETTERIQKRSFIGKLGNSIRWSGTPDGIPDGTSLNIPSAIANTSPSPSPSPSPSKEEKEGREKPRSLEEVQGYAKEIPGLDASAFWDFYSSKGWKVGTQPMKDWRAAARNWLRRDKQEGRVSSNGGDPSGGEEAALKVQIEREDALRRKNAEELEKIGKARVEYQRLLKVDPAAAARLRDEMDRWVNEEES